MRLLSALLLCCFFSVDMMAQCVAPTITSAPAARYAILPGSTQALSVEATGTDLTYRWYFIFRMSLMESTVGTTQSVSLAPYYPSTTYFVEVSNDCGSVSAQTVVCLIPVVSVSRTNLALSNEIQLSAVLDSRVTDPSYPYTFQWYRGASGDTSSPVGAPFSSEVSAHQTVSALTPATYWVRVDGVCAPYDSDSVTVAGTTPTPAPIPTLSVTMLAALAAALVLVGATVSRPH